MRLRSLGFLPLTLAALSGAAHSQNWVPIQPPSASDFSVVVDPTNPDHVVAFDGTVTKETVDGGVTWNPVQGPGAGTTPAGQFTFDDEGSLMLLGRWVGTPPHTNGARVQVRNGTTWQPFGPSFSNSSAEFVQQVVRGASNRDLWAVDTYQAFDFGAGRIYLSDDGGVTWTDTGPAIQYAEELHIVEAQAGPYLVRVSNGSDKANSRRYVQRSSGWSRIDQTLATALDETLAFGFHAGNPESMWTAVGDPSLGSASLLRSNDGGATFGPTGSSLQNEILVANRYRPEWLLRFDSGQFETSTDGGVTWSFVADPPVAGTFSGRLVLTGDGRYLYSWHPNWPSIFRLDLTPFIGAEECSAEPNASGERGRIRALGSLSLAENAIDLFVDRIPAGEFGFFVTGQTPGFVANPGGSYGNLCLSGTIGRYVHLIQNSGAYGTFQGRIDLGAMPVTVTPVPAQVGETWRFQAWFRDQIGGVQGSNFTNAIALTLVQ